MMEWGHSLIVERHQTGFERNSFFAKGHHKDPSRFYGIDSQSGPMSRFPKTPVE
jgi:hypothetical protein